MGVMKTEGGIAGRFPIGYIDEEHVFNIIRESSFKELVNFNSRLCIDLNRMCFIESSTCKNGKTFVEVVYERIPELAIDIEEGVFKIDVAVHNPITNQALYVPMKTKAFLVEASGRSIYSLVNEGENVSSDKKLFYVVTNKSEVRVIRAEISGVVVYVGDVIGKYESVNKMLCIIVREEDVYRLHRCS